MNTELTGDILEIAVPNMATLNEEDQEAFAIARRSGFGASDSSILLGVNKWKTIEDLIIEKRTTGITAEELEVGNKASVRMGHDLEPLILEKFSKKFKLPVIKPEPMYRFKENPCLTVNFDGIITLGDSSYLPVEAKAVSAFGDKYWNKSMSIETLMEGNDYRTGYGDIKEHIEATANIYGIPPYYYTQIQQQMLALSAPFGFFAVLFTKEWEFKAFKIFADPMVQVALVKKANEVWTKIKGEQ